MSVKRFAIGSRTYLDANVYIYAFEGIDAYRRTMAELLAAIDEQDAVVVASELLFTELLPRPIREGRHDLVERYMELIQRAPRIRLAPVDRSVILRSVHLRADFGLRSMDALHLATALVHGCHSFVTNDRRVARVDRIRVLTLDDLARHQSGNPSEPDD